ncbi:MAG TPA: hypothetical protein VEH31_17520 [Streptosporangiaceae bacterium]|nr:hypothetical protein [Streptosporangiaceae bacterium]
MSEDIREAAAEEVIERGRYAAYAQPDGGQGMIIARSTELCESCRTCRCGVRQEPIDLSRRGLAAMLGNLSKLRQLKAAVRI